MCSLEQRGRVFILTLTGDTEHRLSPALISSIRASLSAAKSSSAAAGGRGFALVTAADGRFFSNGFDLASAQSSPSALHHMVSLFRAVVADLLSLPMPTIAAVTGHAAAAGFILALSHDYVEMRGDRGVIYMSEIDLGMPLPPYFLALMRSKIGDARVLREILLEGRRVRGADAAARGIVDGVYGGAEEVVEAAVRRAEEMAARNWSGEVYASIRRGLVPEICRELGFSPETDEDRNKLLAAAAKL